jgi:lipase chaperone LimK
MHKKNKMIQKSLLVSCFTVGIIALVTWLGADAEKYDVESLSESSNISENSGHIESEYQGALERSVVVSSQGVLPYKSRFGLLPDSLQGTVMQQSLQTDDQGNLRISSDIQRVFDFFLSSIEEEELDIILARIDEYLTHYLQEPALAQSKQILAEYIDLKQALYDFEQSRSSDLKALIDSGELQSNKALYLSLLTEQLKAQSDLRAEYLSAEVYEEFYAEEEAFDQYSLARMMVNSDESLSAEEKAIRLAQVDAEAPSDIVESRQQAQITDTHKQRVAEIKHAGGDASQVREVRVEMFGEEAADRFEALDLERSQWQARIDSYLKMRQDILSTEGLSVEERQVQVDSLRESQFDPREQIRVQVYERNADV